MSLVQCMGGWCVKRQACQHFWSAPLAGREPIERLCPKGQEEPEPIRVIPRQEQPA